MIRFIVIAVTALIIHIASAGAETSAFGRGLIARAGGSYVPVGSIKMISYYDPIDFYDSIFLRSSVEFAVSDFFSAGPAVEYSKRRISPDATFSADVSLVNVLVDLRLRHRLTDTGGSFLVAGAGSGIGFLREDGFGSARGTCIYFMGGFDFDIGSGFGLDMLARFSSERLDVENIREYRFDGLSFYAGANYRIGII